MSKSESIKGGKADNMSVKDIADKFNVSIGKIKKQLEMGKEVESEHTDDIDKALEISMDHLSEMPDYYDRLDDMEKEAMTFWGEGKSKVNENTKSLIKRLIRKNFNSKS